MKILKILIIVLTAFVTFNVSAQDANPVTIQKPTYQRNVLQINPLQLTQNTLQISYIKKVNGGKQSLVLAPSIVLKNDHYEDRKGFQMDVQYRFYLNFKKISENNSKVRGYAAPYYSFESIRTNSPITGNLKNVSNEIGGLAGVEVDLFKRVQLDTFLGAGYNFTKFNYYGFTFNESTLKPIVGFNLGFVF